MLAVWDPAERTIESIMYRIDHSYEEYMSPYILPVTANVEDIRVHILRVSGVYLTYTTVAHALGAIKCTITELGVYMLLYILPAIDQSD